VDQPSGRKPSRLGPIVAERVLERPGSKRPIRARLGTPRPSSRAAWECPYQVAGAGDPRVRVAFGEDALQTVILACAGLRRELTRVGASWLGMGAPGIPPTIPDVFGPAFTTHLESVVEKEVVKLGAKLKRAHEKRARRQPRVTYVKERS
jgi:hypothetical protein